MPARIIAIEGSDGVGKATQTQKLVEHLSKDGFSVASMSFPRYGTPAGRKIKNALFNSLIDPIEMAKLFHEDRKAALNDINKMVENNDFVVFDRYKYSSMAHMAARSEEPDKIIEKIKEFEKEIPEADLVIVISISPELSQKMIRDKNKDLHEVDIEYLRKTNTLYEKLAEANKWILINGEKNGDVISIEEMHEKIYSKVKEFFSI